MGAVGGREKTKGVLLDAGNVPDFDFGHMNMHLSKFINLCIIKELISLYILDHNKPDFLKNAYSFVSLLIKFKACMATNKAFAALAFLISVH